MWSSKSSIKSNAVSLKKFYGYIVVKGLVSAEDLTGLKQQIKTDMGDWLSELERSEANIFDVDEDDDDDDDDE